MASNQLSPRSTHENHLSLLQPDGPTPSSAVVLIVLSTAFSAPGHGLSDAPEGAYFMGDLVGDAAGLIEHLGLRDVVFARLSIGGMIGQGLAAERPGRMKRVPEATQWVTLSQIAEIPMSMTGRKIANLLGELG